MNQNPLYFIGLNAIVRTPAKLPHPSAHSVPLWHDRTGGIFAALRNGQCWFCREKKTSASSSTTTSRSLLWKYVATRCASGSRHPRRCRCTAARFLRPLRGESTLSPRLLATPLRPATAAADRLPARPRHRQFLRVVWLVASPFRERRRSLPRRCLATPVPSLPSPIRPAEQHIALPRQMLYPERACGVPGLRSSAKTANYRGSLPPVRVCCWPRRLGVRTRAFQACNTGSNPVGVI